MGNFDFESGRRLVGEGDLAEGIRCFLASLDLDPGHVPAYIELFNAYALAWEESGDPLVLDQMRKVAIAGLRRNPTPEQARLLGEALDRAEEAILAVESVRADAGADDVARRRLPIIRGGRDGRDDS